MRQKRGDSNLGYTGNIPLRPGIEPFNDLVNGHVNFHQSLEPGGDDLSDFSVYPRFAGVYPRLIPLALA